MNLLSKEAPVEESIKRMKYVLDNVGCKINFSTQKHPLKSCYSVNLASYEAPKHIYSNGKGIIPEASMASALGEYIERLQTNNFFIDFYMPKREQYPDEKLFNSQEECLNKELHKIYNPNNELNNEDLIDFNSDYKDKILTLPFVKNSDKKTVYIPFNILANLYVSNGLATGNTPKEAQIQALSEIVERYAKMQIIKNGYALPTYPKEILQKFTEVYTDILQLRKLGYIVEVLDASLGGIFPVTAISLINPKKSTLFVSFGSHPILEVSLQRTMTELMQGRNLEELDNFEVPTFDMSLVADSFNLESHFVDSNGKLGFDFLNSKKSFEFTPWKYTKSGTDNELNFLTDIIEGMNKEIYLREYDYLGFYSCQIIVPDMSEVYPINDLIYNNKNSGKFIRDMVLGFKNYNPEDILVNIESLDESLNMEKYIGVIFKHNFTLGEFKAQILLLLGEEDEALQILEYNNNKLGHIIVEISRMKERELNFDDYKEALYNIYSKEMVQKALDVLSTKETFIDVTLHLDYYNMLTMYDKLALKKAKI